MKQRIRIMMIRSLFTFIGSNFFKKLNKASVAMPPNTQHTPKNHVLSTIYTYLFM